MARPEGRTEVGTAGARFPIMLAGKTHEVEVRPPLAESPPCSPGTGSRFGSRDTPYAKSSIQIPFGSAM
jgi:hypothetical protein